MRISHLANPVVEILSDLQERPSRPFIVALPKHRKSKCEVKLRLDLLAFRVCGAPRLLLLLLFLCAGLGNIEGSLRLEYICANMGVVLLLEHKLAVVCELVTPASGLMDAPRGCKDTYRRHAGWSYNILVTSYNVSTQLQNRLSHDKNVRAHYGPSGRRQCARVVLSPIIKDELTRTLSLIIFPVYILSSVSSLSLSAAFCAVVLSIHARSISKSSPAAVASRTRMAW